MFLFHMFFIQQACSEALVTHGTLEGVEVDDFVTVQATVGGKRCIAKSTLEGFYSCKVKKSSAVGSRELKASPR